MTTLAFLFSRAVSWCVKKPFADQESNFVSFFVRVADCKVCHIYIIDVNTPEDDDIYDSVDENPQDDQNTPEVVDSKQTSLDDEDNTSKALRVLRAGNKRGYDLVDLHDNTPENSWSLPDQLATIFNKNATKLLSFSKIKEKITDHHTIPENVVKKPKMDDWLPPLMNLNPLKGESARQLKRDEFLGDAWDCVMRIMGPLGRLWSEIEQKKQEVIEKELPDLHDHPENLSPEQKEIWQLK